MPTSGDSTHFSTFEYRVSPVNIHRKSSPSTKKSPNDYIPYIIMSGSSPVSSRSVTQIHTIAIHKQQHDTTTDRKLQHMQSTPRHLLQHNYQLPLPPTASFMSFFSEQLLLHLLDRYRILFSLQESISSSQIAVEVPL